MIEAEALEDPDALGELDGLSEGVEDPDTLGELDGVVEGVGVPVELDERGDVIKGWVSGSWLAKESYSRRVWLCSIHSTALQNCPGRTERCLGLPQNLPRRASKSQYVQTHLKEWCRVQYSLNKSLLPS